MKIKKIPYYLAPWFLMAGASLTIGLLSFGGILAIWPILPLAFAGFVLSVAYEGEIYLQNIRGSLKKLFKSNHLERQLAEKCLLDYFPKELDEHCPQFFKDYEYQRQLFDQYEDKRLNKASRDRKRHVDKTLVDMKKWFAVQLFSDLGQQGLTAYQTELRDWFDKSGLRAQLQAKHGSRRGIYNLLKGFCVTAGLFMGLGTTYLLVEAFAIIPWLAVIPAATLPMLIAPMAAIAGVAYGLLVYNAMTDMIATDMVNTWYQKIYNNIDKKPLGHRVVMGTGLAVMFTLTLALSICTAGTWWTVAKTSQPLFRWMGKMPGFIMLVLNPLISSLSTWGFNLENVSETLELVEKWTDALDFKALLRWMGEIPARIMSTPGLLISRLSAWKFNPEAKTGWQLLQSWNLPRMVIAVAFSPLRFLLFIGHLISIGVTADRVPGVPCAASALLGAANEGVEDLHYFEFVGKHDSDLPTKCLTLLFLPLYVLAASWDVMCDEKREELSSWGAFRRVFGKAMDREMGLAAEANVEFGSSEPCGVKKWAWQFEHAVYRIERHKEKHLQEVVGEKPDGEQRKELTALQAELGKYAVPPLPSASLAATPSIATVIEQNHSLFFKPADKAATDAFLKSLLTRVAHGA